MNKHETLIALLVATVAVSLQVASLDGNSILHLLGSIGAVVILSMVFEYLSVALVLTLLMGFAKELSDPMFSYSDLFVDAIGVTIGCLLFVIVEGARAGAIKKALKPSDETGPES